MTAADEGGEAVQTGIVWDDPDTMACAAMFAARLTGGEVPRSAIKACRISIGGDGGDGDDGSTTVEWEGAFTERGFVDGVIASGGFINNLHAILLSGKGVLPPTLLFAGIECLRRHVASERFYCQADDTGYCDIYLAGF